MEPPPGAEQPRQPPIPGDEKPFIPNPMKQFDEERFMPGEGIDFYVDGARFLPENVTYTRCLLRAFTLDQYRVINAMKGPADLEISRGRHPFFGFRHEIRAPKIDPSTIVQITVETIDRSDGEDKIVGFAYFPLFLNMGNKKTVSDRLASDIILQNGRYQIPLYRTRVPVEKDLTLENIQALEKIPCATVLVRCYKAPVEGDKVLSIQHVPLEQWKSKRLIVDPSDY